MYVRSHWRRFASAKPQCQVMNISTQWKNASTKSCHQHMHEQQTDH
jgi:hypothetical protein